MEVTYQVESSKLVYELKFVSKTNMVVYEGLGKAFPRQTQALLYRSGILIASGLVVKHHLDKDNPKLAIRLAAKKVMNKIPFKWIREAMWKEILEKTN